VAVKWPAGGGRGPGGAGAVGRARAGAAGESARALQLVADARAARDRRMLELREAGWLIVEISREVGISPDWVAQIIEHAGGVERERWLQARAELHLRRAQARSDEILARFRAGERPPRVAKQLGLNQQAVWRIVREVGSDADRTARAWALADRHQPRFSDSELLDGLVLVARRLRHVPSDAEYDRAAAELGLASSTTLCQRFDGLQTALQAAGLQAQPQRRWSRWDAEACWRALESVADQLGDPPRYRRYQALARQSDELPSGGVVRNRLGLWSQIAAELTRRRLGGKQGSVAARQGSGSEQQGSGRSRRVSEVRPRLSLPSRAESGIAGPQARAFSDEQLLAGVRAVGESVGHAPSGGDYRRLAGTLALASHATVCVRFGSWSGALRAAGFEPGAHKRTYGKRWDAQACRQALDRVAGELGEWPRYRDYEQLAAGREDLPSGAMLRHRLGTWSQIAAVLRERRSGDGVPRELPEETYAAA
jgi:AraC-like DNA-binding protein